MRGLARTNCVMREANRRPCVLLLVAPVMAYVSVAVGAAQGWQRAWPWRAAQGLRQQGTDGAACSARARRGCACRGRCSQVLPAQHQVHRRVQVTPQPGGVEGAVLLRQQGNDEAAALHTTHSGAHRCLSAAVPNSCQPERPLCSCLVLPLKICNEVTCQCQQCASVGVSPGMLLLLHVSVTKVINLGTFATEDEAARVWNEAALLFRGGRQAPATACGVLCIVVLWPILSTRECPKMLWVAAVVACHCCVCLHAWPTSQELCPFSVLCVLCVCVAPAGSDAWLNPVEPQLPDDYTPGELHLASDKAASAVRAAAVAAGLPTPKVVVKG